MAVAVDKNDPLAGHDRAAERRLQMIRPPLVSVVDGKRMKDAVVA